MAKKERRQYKNIFDPTAGLFYNQPSTLIEDRATRKCSNVRFFNHNIEQSIGTSYFAGTDSSPLTGKILGFWEFAPAGGVPFLYSSRRPKLRNRTWLTLNE